MGIRCELSLHFDVDLSIAVLALCCHIKPCVCETVMKVVTLSLDR